LARRQNRAAIRPARLSRPGETGDGRRAQTRSTHRAQWPGPAVRPGPDSPASGRRIRHTTLRGEVWRAWSAESSFSLPVYGRFKSAATLPPITLEEAGRKCNGAPDRCPVIGLTAAAASLAVAASPALTEPAHMALHAPL